jgi:hypothetical protein
MKKILTVILAASLMMAVSACGKNVSDGDAGKGVVQGGAAVDEQGNEIVGTTIDGAGAEVDMKKIEGTELKAESGKASGKIRDFEVSVGEAKTLETEVEGQNKKVVIVAFTFKNKSSQPAAFDNALKVTAMQGDTVLNAKPVSGIEGLNMRSGVEFVDPKKTNNVQKVFVLADDETPVTVTVSKPDEQDKESVTRTFNLK